MTYALRAEGLVKRYGSTTGLDGVDLAVPPGRVLGLLGPNGAGKTTAVRILATLIRPDAGTAEIYGHDLLRAPDRVRARIALTGQYAAVDEALTGAENLRVIARLLAGVSAVRVARGRGAVDDVRLTRHRRRP
jgi:oleandomycin transport system ATP-binding protein